MRILLEHYLRRTDADLAVRYFADADGRFCVDIYYLRGILRWIGHPEVIIGFPRGTRCIFDTVSLAPNVILMRRDEPRVKECAVTFAEEGPAGVQWFAPKGSTRRLFLVERSTPWGQALVRPGSIELLEGLFDGPTALKGCAPIAK